VVINFVGARKRCHAHGSIRLFLTRIILVVRNHEDGNGVYVYWWAWVAQRSSSCLKMDNLHRAPRGNQASNEQGVTEYANWW